ncbi:MAG: NADP-dependent oxidoreductase [Pseudomonadota bacterium]
MADNRSWHLVSYPDGMPSVDNWALRETSTPVADDDEVLITTQWLSVDPYLRGRISPAKNYASGFQPGDLMRSGGVGQVVNANNSQFREGDIVFSDHCGWEEISSVPVKSLRKLDPNDAPVQASLSFLGLPGLTAYFALLRTAAPQSGETVLISAASGAVGQIAGQIAKIKELNPVAVCGSDEKIQWCSALGYSAGINHRSTDDLVKAVANACPNGVDIYLDNTAGPIHDAAMLNLNTRGRIIVIGTIALASRFGQPDIGLRHLRQILITRARVEGFLLDDFAAQYDTARCELTNWFEAGLLQHKEDIADGIEQVPHAFIRMLEGKNVGKQLVRL